MLPSHLDEVIGQVYKSVFGKYMWSADTYRVSAISKFNLIYCRSIVDLPTPLGPTIPNALPSHFILSYLYLRKFVGVLFNFLLKIHITVPSVPFAFNPSTKIMFLHEINAIF